MFEISRRDLVLGSTGAALVFGLKGPVSFIGAAHAQRAADSLKYKVGDIEVFSLHEGSIERTVAEGMVKNAADSLKYKVGDIEVFSLHESCIERTVAEGMVKNAADSLKYKVGDIEVFSLHE